MKNRMFKTLINSLVLGAVLTIGYIAGSTLPMQAKASDSYYKLEWTEMEQVGHTNEPAGLSQAEIDLDGFCKQHGLEDIDFDLFEMVWEEDS